MQAPPNSLVPPATTPPKPKSEPVNSQPVPAAAPAIAKSASPVQPPPAARTASSTGAAPGVTHGKVLQQVLPNAAQSARDTIRGTVRVSVKVQVDESGAVTQATIDSRGPSQFFADRALHAAQLWKFAPAQQDGRAVPSEWLIHFEIDSANINVRPTETAP
jgi:protein TonB